MAEVIEVKDSIPASLAQKLHPRRYTAMSGKMAAILAYILGEHWTEPGIAELAITGDSFVLAREEGDVGCNNWTARPRTWRGMSLTCWLWLTSPLRRESCGTAATAPG